MEITVRNGMVTIVGATRQELIELAQFMNGEPIPFNTVNKTTDVVVEATTEIETEINEPRLVTIGELCKILGRSSATMQWHINHGMPIADNNRPRKFNVDDCREYLSTHNIEHYNKNRIKKEPVKAEFIEPIVTDDANMNWTIPKMAKELGLCHQTVEFRIKRYGIPYTKVGRVKYFDIADVKANLEQYPIKDTKPKAKAVKLEKVVTPYGLWRQEQSAKVRMSGRDVGKTFSAVYKEMTKVWGISWDQVAKDFRYEKGYRAKSTIELVYFLQYEQCHKSTEHYENLFENELDKVLAA